MVAAYHDQESAYRSTKTVFKKNRIGKAYTLALPKLDSDWDALLLLRGLLVDRQFLIELAKTTRNDLLDFCKNEAVPVCVTRKPFRPPLQPFLNLISDIFDLLQFSNSKMATSIGVYIILYPFNWQSCSVPTSSKLIVHMQRVLFPQVSTVPRFYFHYQISGKIFSQYPWPLIEIINFRNWPKFTIGTPMSMPGYRKPHFIAVKTTLFTSRWFSGTALQVIDFSHNYCAMKYTATACFLHCKMNRTATCKATSSTKQETNVSQACAVCDNVNP